ncbi:MAG: hypothetical protein WAK48_29005 [Candidatus Acidiferrum sp.]|jgi:hypothetical protein
MKILNRFFLVALFFLAGFAALPSWAQTKTQKAEAAASLQSDEQKNVQAYIDLLRTDVRQQKAEMMGAVMLLSAQDAAKFWPIYSEYDAQLTKLNDQRVQTIKDYAKNYDLMTDAKADELIQKSIAYQKQRAELLAQTYDKVKQALGAVTAARFAMIEHQLLLIIDLQIASSLPVVGQGS